MSKQKVSVIGHMNPDTDSICSAISYAYLKRQITGENYEPRRAGAINPETRFVLDHFHMEEPRYMDDVRPRIRDIEVKELMPFTKDVSVRQAWEYMNDNKVVALAINDEAGHMIGIISLGDITRSYMMVYDNTTLGKANTPYENILDTLQGEMVVGDPSDRVSCGKTLVAAANPDVMESFIEPNDMVILGNRYESQLCAIEMEAGCIIVTNGDPVSRTICKLAAEHGCHVISTDYDTYTVSRLLYQSIPVGHFMNQGEIISFQVDDFLDDVSAVMAEKRHRYFPVLNRDGDYAGMISRRNLLSASKKRLILVDHNEKSQAVPGLSEAKIMEIIDHHRIADIETMGPVYFRNQPVGCTATIINLMYQENDVEIPADIAGLMMSAILSDTLAFRSPTCTPLDKKTAEKLAKIAGIEDIDAYACKMFEAGSELDKQTPEGIFTMDFKKFHCDDYAFGVGQISCMGRSAIDSNKERLVAAIEEFRLNQRIDMVYLLMTDILTSTSEVIYCGSKAGRVIGIAFDKRDEVEVDTLGTVVLEDVISRKKQFIPKMMEAFHEL